jgi:hemerythrin-like metal-binding protein
MTIPLLDGSLKLGETTFDEQNQELIDQFNVLSRACQEGGCGDVIFDVIKYVNRYVSDHFSYEEALMQVFKYPQLEGHKEEHNRFRGDVEKYNEMLAHYESLEELTIKVYRTLFQWVINHVRKLDKDMIEYVKLQTG